MPDCTDWESLVGRIAAWAAQDTEYGTELATWSLNPTGQRMLAEPFTNVVAFGTAGIRAVMGPGPGRMNQIVVEECAAAIFEHLVQDNETTRCGDVRIVIGYDGRLNSARYAHAAAQVLAGLGAQVHLFGTHTPTPVLAYAIRELGADAGLMVTASHNPREENGMKLYLGDGRQIISPVDTSIATILHRRLRSICEGNRERCRDAAAPFTMLDGMLVDAYVARVVHTTATDLPLDTIAVAYTPLHGVGHAVLADVCALLAHVELHTVADQQDPDGTFPSCPRPNPENDTNLAPLLELAESCSAQLAVANDPDADRCRIAVRDRTGTMQLLNGDEIGALLLWWLAQRRGGALDGTVASSVVSSTLTAKLAVHYGAQHVLCATGFKWLTRPEQLVYAYEEALGYCCDPSAVNDKDGISAAAHLITAAAWLHARHSSLHEQLLEMYREHGTHLQAQISFPAGRGEWLLPGVPGEPVGPTQTVSLTENLDMFDLAYGTATGQGLHTAGGGATGRMIVRRSGTEPIVKLYLEAVSPNPDDAQRALDELVAYTQRRRPGAQ
jgi:phosphomannomutase